MDSIEAAPAPQWHRGVDGPADPRVAIVVPVFKHSSLVAEALDSALSQEASFGILTIIVNDGCPFVESREICRDFALAYPGRVVYLHKPNGGLSSARNAGIAYILANCPSVEAIYFLDADNRLTPRAMAGAFAELERHQDAAWIYPNIDMFGLREAWDFVGGYSIIRHLSENICEAGSLVRRRVFEAGPRFDESMKSGYEDWDFWLSAAELGFRGRCLGTFGFQYRRRPESMLSGSYRDDQAIRSYMRKKHRKLLAVSALVAEEHEAHPRYAVYLQDTDTFLLATDVRHGGERLSFDTFEPRYWEGLLEPARAEVPGFVVATTTAAIELLQAYGLLPWALWRLEDRLGEAQVAGFWTGPPEAGTRMVVEDFPINQPMAAGGVPLLAMIPRTLLDSCVKDRNTTWFDSLLTGQSQVKSAWTRLTLPQESPIEASFAGGLPNVDPFATLQWIVRRLHHSRHRTDLGRTWNWRKVPEPSTAPAFTVVRKLAGTGAALLPRTPATSAVAGRDIAFALPFVSFGGVEKVAVNIAAELGRRGFTPHLVLMDRPNSVLPASIRRHFDSVSFLCEPGVNRWNAHEIFLGTAISEWSRPGNDWKIQRVVGLLSGFDVVINAHCKDLNAVMGELKRSGVKTLTHQHVVDLSISGRPNGHPYLGLAYEHAYDAVVCVSHTMRDWFSGMGMPADKLIVVENAPSFSIGPADCEAALADRANRSGRDPLRILVLGRLDRQKGLERVGAVYEGLAAAGIATEWRLVGGQVIAEGAIEVTLPNDIRYPPATSPEALAELYAWADVLLLMSSWEGLPLTILEAMPFGCVPIVTDVGAVREAVRDGVTGIVLDLEGSERQACESITGLQSDRQRLMTLAHAASRAGLQRSWARSVEPLVQRLETWERERASR